MAHIVALHMSAIGGKADMGWCVQMSANDPKRTSPFFYAIRLSRQPSLPLRMPAHIHSASSFVWTYRSAATDTPARRAALLNYRRPCAAR